MSDSSVQRRRVIITYTREHGQTGVSELSARLGVAPETIRRDLTVLERQGLVRRTHGAVYPLDNAGYESSLEYRSSHMVSEKRRIAEAAAELIGDAGSIFLDEGFTPRLVAEVLVAEHRALTVVTPSLPAAIALSASPQMSVIMLGGRMRGLTLGTVGHWVTDMIVDLVIDVAVVGTNGISLQRGLTTPNPEISDVKSKVVRHSRRSLLVGVHTKFGIDSFSRFAGVPDMHAIITDRGLSARDAQRYADAGPRVIRA